MAEDDSKQDLFNAAGQTPGYISLDEARVLAVERARDNRVFLDAVIEGGSWFGRL